MHLLKRILTAVILIPIVLVLVLRAPVPVVALVAALVALLTVQELLKLAEAYGIRPLRWPTYIFVGLFFLLLAINPGNEKPLLSSAIFIYGTGVRCRYRSVCFSHGCHATGQPQPGISGCHGFLFLRVCVRGFAVGVSGAIAGAVVRGISCSCICCCWFGRETSSPTSWDDPLGRHLMSPRISPQKTWEGALASLLASLVVGMLLYNYALPISTALLHGTHLIERRDGFFSRAEATARSPRYCCQSGHQYRGAVGGIWWSR